MLNNKGNYSPEGLSTSDEFQAPEGAVSSVQIKVPEGSGLTYIDNLESLIVRQDKSEESISSEFAKRLQEHQNICNYLHDLYYRKNSDYGGSVTDTFNKYGLVSFLVRLEDKLNRARSLNNRGSAKVTDEKLEDTLMDMANYAMLAVIELRMSK